MSAFDPLRTFSSVAASFDFHKRLERMAALQTPEHLRAVAQHCRSLAASCITRQAREPLEEMVNKLEEAADDRRLLRQRLLEVDF